MYKILGLEKSKSYTVSSSLTFPYPCNFLSVNRLKIKSSVLSQMKMHFLQDPGLAMKSYT